VSRTLRCLLVGILSLLLLTGQAGAITVSSSGPFQNNAGVISPRQPASTIVLGSKGLVYPPTDRSTNTVLTQCEFSAVTTGSSADVTITLPAASTLALGTECVATKVDAGTNSVIVAPTGADMLNGVNSAVSTAIQYEVFVFKVLSSSAWGVEVSRHIAECADGDGHLNYTAAAGFTCGTAGGGGASAFTALTDVPASYTGAAGQFVAVNGGETGLAFVPAISSAQLVRSATVTLDATAIRGLNTTPVALVPPPGAGLALRLLGVFGRYNYTNATPYNADAQIRFFYGNPALGTTDNTFFTPFSSTGLRAWVPLATAASGVTVTVGAAELAESDTYPSLLNVALYAQADTDSFGGGDDSTVVFTLLYVVLDTTTGAVVPLYPADPTLSGSGTVGAIPLWTPDTHTLGVFTPPGTDGQCLTRDSGQASGMNAQACGGGGVTGSGTQNVLPKWDSSGTNLVNSQVTDDGTLVTMGNLRIGPIWADIDTSPFTMVEGFTGLNLAFGGFNGVLVDFYGGHGNVTAPASSVTGDLIMALVGHGIDSAGSENNHPATMAMYARDVATGSIAGEIQFLTAPPGSSTSVLAMAILKDQSTVTYHQGLGVTSADGIVLANTTAAGAGAPQLSPRLRLHGQGWKTTATAANEPVDWIMENLPIEGTTTPRTQLQVGYSLNNGSYVYPLSLYVGDTLTTANTAVFSYAGSVAAPFGATTGIELQNGGRLHFRSLDTQAIFYNSDGTLGMGATGTTLVRSANSIQSLEVLGGSTTWALQGNAPRSIGLLRHTTSNTAGNSLTISGGGATSAATDKAGGDLILAGGIPTGTGTSGVQLQSTLAGSTGTSDGTPATHLHIKNGHVVTKGGTGGLTGTNCTALTGNDNAGVFTSGNVGAFSCVLAFNQSYTTNAPACSCNNAVTANLCKATSTTSQVTFAGVSALNDVLTYSCLGFE